LYNQDIFTFSLYKEDGINFANVEIIFNEKRL